MATPSPLAARPLVLTSLFVSCWLATAAAQAPTTYRFAREGVLGTSSNLAVHAVDEATGKRAEAAVFAEVERLAAVLSTWDETSELSRLVAAGGGTPSAELAEVLALASAWRERSQGAFDAGVARASSLWQRAAKDGKAPTDGELAATAKAMREPSFVLADGKLTVHGPLTLDALAKGYVVDRAAKAVGTIGGATLVSFQIGGDTVLGTHATDIALVDPRQPTSNGAPLATLHVAGRAVASSGGYARGFDIGKQHHSHILDPRTGKPCDGVLGASVVAADAATADALATTLCVLGPKDGLALLAKTPGAEAVLVTADGKEHRSPGFAKLLAATTPVASDASADGKVDPKAWPAGFGLQVEFEIKAPDTAAGGGGRGRGGWKRPYVAVWIEDITGAPVRTLCLWIEDKRWLRDLRRWTRANAEAPQLTGLVSQATRKAGAYTLAWDGKDDEGRQVIANKYTVCIEVVREHGTYQLIKREIELLQKPVELELEGNAEVAKAKLVFGKAARSVAK